MKKLLLAILFSLMLTLAFEQVSKAYTLRSREEMGFDESIADQSQTTIAAPSKIFITRVLTANEEYEAQTEIWVKSLYYYSITRLGFLDLPYTYLVDRDGKVYEGRAGGIYTDPETVQTGGQLVIGYLSNSEDVTALASQSLRQLITEISYTYGVTRSEVQIGKLDIAEGGEVAKTILLTDGSSFTSEIETLLNSFTYSEVEHIKYRAAVKSVTYAKTVEASEKFTVEATLINTNDFPWFTNNNYIYVSTRNKQESPFAVNGVWDSFSKPVAITDKVVLPGKELVVTFDMQAMLLPGKYTARFNLMKLPNVQFAGSNFDVAFEIKKGSAKLVRIIGIPSLNVRECIGSNCKVLTQVAENQVLIMLEKNAGWYKIRYSEKASGWVYGQYVEQL
ncbi:SH3 domain-containing protein [bacterium]|nr:SH3 domain-containing protein [bacterium]